MILQLSLEPRDKTIRINFMEVTYWNPQGWPRVSVKLGTRQWFIGNPHDVGNGKGILEMLLKPERVSANHSVISVG